MLYRGLGLSVSSNPILLLLTLISILSCIGMVPVNDETQIESLAGIQRVYVIVNIGLSIDGPTRKSLQEEVERQLRDGGIQVLQYVQGTVIPSVPIFNVEVAIWRNAENAYIYFVNANLFQPVHLVRNEQFMTQAMTWQSKNIGSGMLVHIHKVVAKLSEKFVMNVQNANRQKSNIQ